MAFLRPAVFGCDRGADDTCEGDAFARRDARQLRSLALCGPVELRPSAFA